MSDIWDTGHVGNGFMFKCGLDPNQYNDLFAFTLGNTDFLSVKAKSLQELVSGVESRSKVIDPKTKKVKNLLLVSVPPRGDIVRWIGLLKNPKNNLDRKFRIRIYDSPDRNRADANTTLVFHNVNLKGNGESPKLFGAIPMPTATLFPFEYDSNVEIIGQRG